MKYAFAFTVLALTGCAASPEQLALQAEYERTVPTCSNETQCRVMWEAAQIWVVNNAGYRIQTATDVIIETYGPLGTSTDLAARITKEPIGQNNYRFPIVLGCANLFGCFPNALQSAVAFNTAVSNAGQGVTTP